MLRRLGVFVCLFLISDVLHGQPPAEKKDEPFKNLKYRLVGPMAGGRVSRACGVAGDPNTYYFGAASGGVWKSTDAGVTWKSIFDDQPTSSIGAIAVAPSDPNVVYVGSGEANIRGNVAPGNGIYRSTNGGKTWSHVWKRDKTQIGQIAVHPKNEDIAFAAVLGSAFGPSPERGVYRTTDGGKTWTQVLKKDADTGAIEVAIDPSNPRIVFAALWQARRTPWSLVSGGPGSGLYRSDDGGDTWKQLGLDGAKDDKHGLPKGPWGRIGLAIAPSRPDRIFALIEAEKGGLYRSDDGGDEWTLVSAGRYLNSRPWYFSTLTVDPANADVVWVNNVRLLKSVDGGATFKNVKGPHHVDHHDLWIDPKNPRRIIDSNDGGVDISTDGGETWFAPHLPICQLYHISVDASSPYRILGNMQDMGSISGPSNSLSSAGISLSDWHTVGGGETGTSLANPRHPNIVYSGEYMGIITRFDRRTRQAQNISAYPYNASGKGAGELRYRYNWTAPILISPHDPDTVYHGANVLFRTRNQGRTWQILGGDMTRNDKSKQQWTGGPITGDNTGAEHYCTLFQIAESPKKAGVLWVGSDDGLVHVSLDDGATWTNVTAKITGLPEWATIACIEPSRADAGTAYVIADAHRLDDNRPYLWKTTDFGQSWTRLSDALPQSDYLRVIREDPADPMFLFVGSEHRVSMSRDGGATWEPLELNMPTVAVSDLAVKNNDLVVGTSGRSIYLFDDLTPIKSWSPVKKDQPRLFPVRAAIRWHYEDENYVGEDRMPGDNPPTGAIISYYLPTKPKADLVLEIHDAKKNVVARFTNKKQEPEYKEDDPDRPWSLFKPTVLPTEPGIQRVNWDLTYSGPKIIPGAKNDAGIPYRGPLAPPGIYMARLTVDDVVLSEPIVVTLDPRSTATKEDLAEAHTLALRLRADIWRLSEIVVGIRSLRGQLVQRQEIWKDNPKAAEQRKAAAAIEKKIDDLEAQLHNPDAEIFYDILAKKGGAKLYSQLGWLYYFARTSEGPVTQGQREVAADYEAELKKLDAVWMGIVSDDVARFNRQSRDLELPAVAVPRPDDIPARPLLMKRRKV